MAYFRPSFLDFSCPSCCVFVFDCTPNYAMALFPRVFPRMFSTIPPVFHRIHTAFMYYIAFEYFPGDERQAR